MDSYINQLTEKTNPASNDLILIWDSAVGATKYVQKSNLGTGTWFKDTATTMSAVFDGVIVAYTLSHAPLANAFRLIVQGQEWTEGVDYTLSGTTLTLTTALPSGFTGSFIAQYQY